ncbi:uncharacterized protein LOC125067605 [Vanessa atalanta]|uniref:uncharacterized protein LOC125067605 n=1 Tax=Vanessa atalanta TaxID=42275 RepID=UPI001FCDD00B|nr:uncharacterized protein LOC125067605 [Vanessa atalanta]
MDLSYMKRIKFYFTLLGAWPYKELYETYKEKPRKIPLRNYKTLFVLWIGVLLSGVLYLKSHIRKLSFFELGHSYITVFMNFIAVQRVSTPIMKSYRRTVVDFVLKLHLFHHKHKSEYAMKVYQQVHRISSLFSIFLYILMYVGNILFQLMPLYNNIQSGAFKATSHSIENGTRYEHSVYHYTPFEYHNFGYSVIFIINWILVFDCSITFCTYDSLMTLIVFNIWGHLKILKYNLEHFPRPRALGDTNSTNSIMYTDEELKNVQALLKENIAYHIMVTRFMSQASKAFGPIMCFYYLFDQVSGCILLLELSAMDMEAIVSYGILTAILLQQLVQISAIFEIIGSQSETLKNTIYNLPWEYMDVENRKIVLIFLNNSQKPITLKAMGMIYVGVQTMATIMKTSVSYFIMLRTFAEK